MKTNITLALIFVHCIVNAQDTIQKTNVQLSGSLDAYFRYNFHNAKRSGNPNNFTSFTHSHNSFELGMVSLKAAVNTGKVQAVADLGFGKRAAEFSYNDNPSVFNLKQVFVSYSPTAKVKFTMGKWYTHVGYEVADAYLNHNYSMAYLFSYGPFFHSGIKMEWSPTENLGIMAGIANPTDFSSADFSKKNVIGQLHMISNNKKVNAYLNYVVGRDSSDTMVSQIDVVVTGTFSDRFGVACNGSLKSVNPANRDENKMRGLALYVNYDPFKTFGLSLRSELFNDEKNVSGVQGNIYDFTLSGNIHSDNLTIVPEVRLDAANHFLFFTKTDYQVASAKATASFILAATYHF